MCLFFALAGCFVAVSVAMAQPEQEGREADETAMAPEDFDALAQALFGEDAEAQVEARSALLLHPMTDDEQVRLLSLARDTDQLVRVREIVQHRVLTQLREEEFADADPENAVVGFRFICSATSSVIEDLDEDLAAQYPWGARVRSATPGFPGNAYLRVGDVVVAIDAEALPEGSAAGQNFLLNTVSSHTVGQTIELTVLRDGEVVTMEVPLVRREAMAQMYDSQGVSTELIDPFLFLWEEAWATLLFEADREALAQRLEKEDDPALGRPTVRPLPIRPAGGR